MKSIIILNTRPISESDRTANAFIKHGFDVFSFPCIEIVASKNMTKCLQQLNNIPANNTIIFTSVQAVIYTYKIFPKWITSPDSHIIAVGDKTACQLEKHTDNKIQIPHIQNSQGVIDLLGQLKSVKNITLITAENGRQEIQFYAKKNNIELSQINVYDRQLPDNNQSIDSLLKNFELCVLATSINILKNLKALLEKKQWAAIKKSLIVCASERIETFAIEMGLGNTLNTSSANPNIMAQVLIYYLNK